MDIVLPVSIGILFGPLMLVRLNYIDGQFDKLLLKFQKSLKSVDEKFQQELARTPPRRDVVLSYATQMGAQSTICDNIKGYSAKNRLYIGFDLAAIITAIGISAVEGSNGIQFETTAGILRTVLVTSVVLSLLTFIEKYSQFHRLKNKAMSIKD